MLPVRGSRGGSAPLSNTGMKKGVLLTLVVITSLIASILPAAAAKAAEENSLHPVLIFDYHRFNTYRADSMTVTLSVFKFQLQYLETHGYHFIPLARYVAYRMGKASPPPAKSVIVTMDDGNETVYKYALPFVRKYRIPVTLFIYPSAISNASYAMTWQQLRALKATGLFTIQSHTYWHPNFNVEKRRLSPAKYDKFVNFQLRRSKEVLEKKLGIKVTMLAWPYGIYNEGLIHMAEQAGYTAAFALNGRHAGNDDNIMAISRYLVSDRDHGRFFEEVLAGTPARH